MIPSSVWSEALWDVIISVTLTPTRVGFNMGDVDVMLNLPQHMLQILTVVSKCLPAKLTDSFIRRLEDSIARGT